MAMRQASAFRRHKDMAILLSMLLALIYSAGARGADQIRVGYGSLSVNYAAIWTAGEARLFQKNGIDAEVLYLKARSCVRR
jgi:ABC-type nitrate/sulfonate/bicarbonate transport system substrate-binding protein